MMATYHSSPSVQQSKLGHCLASAPVKMISCVDVIGTTSFLLLIFFFFLVVGVVFAVPWVTMGKPSLRYGPQLGRLGAIDRLR
jgi:hypothetical protein